MAAMLPASQAPAMTGPLRVKLHNGVLQYQVGVHQIAYERITMAEQHTNAVPSSASRQCHIQLLYDCEAVI